MGKEKRCKNCGDIFIAFMTTQNKCRDCTYKTTKPIEKHGKNAKLWDTFRDTVARPHLDRRDGMRCVDCHILPRKKKDGTYYRHDVDHIKGRGGHAEKKYDLKNLVYRCRNCHRLKTDGKTKGNIND